MKFLYVTMPDNTIWAVPVKYIAENRAKYYAHVDNLTFDESLINDTLPYFEESAYNIKEWAEHHMDWEDVSGVASLVSIPRTIEEDYHRGWINGHKEIVER